MGLVYSEDSLELTSVFKSYRNSLNIYTEDQDEDKMFYKSLLGRLLKNTDCEINDITPLGNCHTVEKASKSSPDPKGIYIIDGDINTILSPKQCTSHLYVLDAYCIENKVIDNDSVVNLAYNLCGRMNIDDLSECLKIDSFMLSITEPLTQLFFYFALEKKYMKCFKIKHFDYFFEKDIILSRSKINKEIESIKNKLVPCYITEQQLDNDLIKLRSRFPVELDSLLTIVSGKDYLIPCIVRYISKQLQYKFSLPKQAWKYNMSRYCNLSKLEGLKLFVLEKFNNINA